MRLTTLSLLTAFALTAQTASAREEAPIPPLPDADHYEELIDLEDAEIIIRRTDEGRVREFRRGGRTYMIEVHPENAPPYHLVDHDGDGDLSQRHDGPYDPRNLPRWVIFSW